MATLQLSPVAMREGHNADAMPDGGAAGRHVGQPSDPRRPARMVMAARMVATRVARLRNSAAKSSAGRRPQSLAAGGTAGRPDWASDLATLAIVVTAGVASWAGWVYLAEAVGWGTWPLPWIGLTFHLSWLLPLSVDVYAFVAARAWLGRGLDADTRIWGRNSAWGALALSMVGNAGGHAVEAGVWSPDWRAVVVVAMIPPAMLFLALHLRTMRTRDREAIATREAKRAAKEQAVRSDGTAHREQRRQAAPSAGPSSAVTATAKPSGEPLTMANGSANGHAKTSASDTAERVRAAYEAAVANGQADAMTATELATAIAAEIGDVSARTVRRHLTPLRRRMASGQNEDGGQ